MDESLIISNIEKYVTTSVTYSSQSNAFLTAGYVSLANNVYFDVVRFAEGIIIKESVGQGYCHKFLNGIRIYSVKNKTLLADRNFNTCFYSTDTVIEKSKEMLLDMLEKATASQGISFNRYEASKSIREMIIRSFRLNQLEVASSQTKYLKAG